MMSVTVRKLWGEFLECIEEEGKSERDGKICRVYYARAQTTNKKILRFMGEKEDKKDGIMEESNFSDKSQVKTGGD